MTTGRGAPVRPADTHLALPAAWADDPFLLQQREWWDVERVHEGDGAVLLRSAARDGGGVGLLGLGTGPAVAGLVQTHAPGDGPYRQLTIPTDALPLVDGTLLHDLRLRAARTGWEWLVTERAPERVPGEELVVPLDPVRSADAVAECLAEANPTTGADPATPGYRWWGRWDDAHARLLGVVAAEPWTGKGGATAWHLHGLGVRPSARGGGAGAAITAAAVRAGIDGGAPCVSLGMWDDNHGARRLYHRLGLRTQHRLTTLRRPRD